MFFFFYIMRTKLDVNIIIFVTICKAFRIW
jgi:hypothetical protein